MDRVRSFTDYKITGHARDEMLRRQITEIEVNNVLSAPEQTEPVGDGRIVCQSRLPFDEPAKMSLLRVFLDIDRSPPTVVTVYRTTKIAKYWRTET